MATRPGVQISRPLPGQGPQLPWKAIAIGVSVAFVLLLVAAVVFVVGGVMRGKSSPAANAPVPVTLVQPGQSSQSVAPVAPIQVVIVTPAPAKPAPLPVFGSNPIPGNGLTPGVYTEPGKPGEMTDGIQIAASFILLSARGRVDEALKLAGPSRPSPALVRQTNLLAERYPNGFKKGVEIDSVRFNGVTLRLPLPSPRLVGILYEDVVDTATGNALHLGDGETLRALVLVPEKNPAGQQVWYIR